MSGRVKGKPRASEVDMGGRALKEHQEIARRRAEQVLKEAAPRFRDKGWTVTKEER